MEIERAREKVKEQTEKTKEPRSQLLNPCLLFYSRASLITTSVLSAPSQQTPGRNVRIPEETRGNINRTPAAPHIHGDLK